MFASMWTGTCSSDGLQVCCMHQGMYLRTYVYMCVCIVHVYVCMFLIARACVLIIIAHRLLEETKNRANKYTKLQRGDLLLFVCTVNARCTMHFAETVGRGHLQACY